MIALNSIWNVPLEAILLNWVPQFDLREQLFELRDVCVRNFAMDQDTAVCLAMLATVVVDREVRTSDQKSIRLVT
jgi:hypothetical protein